MIVGSNSMITKERHPMRVLFLRDHEERRARQQKEAGASAKRQVHVPHTGPGFGPLVASRPAS
jgi:hypothetical protein